MEGFCKGRNSHSHFNLNHRNIVICSGYYNTHSNTLGLLLCDNEGGVERLLFYVRKTDMQMEKSTVSMLNDT